MLKIDNNRYNWVSTCYQLYMNLNPGFVDTFKLIHSTLLHDTCHSIINLTIFKACDLQQDKSHIKW